MAYREIIVQVDNGKDCDARLGVAAALASRFDSRLTGVFADAGVSWPMPLAGVPSMELLDALEQARGTRRSEARAAFGPQGSALSRSASSS